VVVPAAAVRSAVGAGGEVVLCGADQRAHVAQVKTGVRLDDVVEVTGVSARDMVAVEPVLGIADGDKLEPPDTKTAAKDTK
jgi:hypothetical protein